MESVATPRLYRIEDIMVMLSVSRATVNREIYSGRLKVSRIGVSVRIPSDELEKYLNSIKT